jgi:DNA-binding winged helix-turn-helix (wHTH) protein
MIRIGRLKIDLEQRVVLHDGAALRLGSRAIDLLELMIMANGALVSKDEIMRRVWPETIVEENNLHVQVSALRKALGCDRDLIKTVPGRGYRLICQPQTSGCHCETPASRAENHVLPAPVAKLIGRESVVSGAVAALEQNPVASLVGAAGIGKTTIAIEVARQVARRFPDGVQPIDLATVSSADAALDLIARAVTPEFSGLASPQQIAEALASQECLVLLVNCIGLISSVRSIGEQSGIDEERELDDKKAPAI